jgi:transcription termination factor 2
MEQIALVLKKVGLTLRSYQVDGVSWMRQHEKEGDGGILADEPGLGKTLQALALAIPDEDTVPPTLVVVPKSVVGQWLELAQAIFGKKKVFCFDDRTTKAKRNKVTSFQGYRVVITTYPILILNEKAEGPTLWFNEAIKYDFIQPSQAGELKHLFKKLPKKTRHFWNKRAKQTASPLHWTRWHRIILDEAHRIKNAKTNGHKVCCQLKTSYRWALTGTPIQNRLQEFKSLFCFALGRNHITTENLECLQQTHLLRRTKADFLTSLPPIVEEYIEVIFETQEEQDTYTYIQEEVYSEISRLKDTFRGQNTSLLQLEHLLRLRQAAQHPSLFLNAMKRKHQESPTQVEEEPGLPLSSSKHNRLRQLLQDHQSQPALIFFQFTEELDYLRPLLREFTLFRLDGSMNTRERNAEIAKAKRAAQDFHSRTPAKLGESAETRPPVFCIQIVTGGMGLNLQDYNHVYILSPDWNPFNEIQAIGRAYRSGQERPVVVRRLGLVYPPSQEPKTLEGIVVEGGGEMDEKGVIKKIHYRTHNTTIDQTIRSIQDAKLVKAAEILRDESISPDRFRHQTIELLKCIESATKSSAESSAIKSSAESSATKSSATKSSATKSSAESSATTELLIGS